MNQASGAFRGSTTVPGSGDTLSKAIENALTNAEKQFGERPERVEVIYQELAVSSPETFNVVVRIPDR
jgi:hypothetical protein